MDFFCEVVLFNIHHFYIFLLKFDLKNQKKQFFQHLFFMKNKKILLGVSGSISAYKSALLTRLLVKAGAEVKVIMTQSATTFITPLTLATLSKNPVLVEFVKNEAGEWNNHVELGLWADAIIIAPTSANTLAKCATGLCDNLLTAVYLSAKCPVFFAPAMDLDMYLHPTTQENLKKLESFGNFIIPAEDGELASGLVGQGRLAEPEHIFDFLENYFLEKELFFKFPNLKNKRVLLTAGGTQEAIDPVRYISNHSTGKMGYAIAQHLADAGAKVELVSGKTFLQLKHKNISLHQVVSAQEMYEKCEELFEKMDIIILCAAVADFTPENPANEKIKKKEGENNMNLVLKKTVDIAHTLGTKKQVHQLFIGFALETNNELENAEKKLAKKNFDYIILNSLRVEGAGFATDTNAVTLLGKNGYKQEFPLQSKHFLAEKLRDWIGGLYV